MSWYQTQQKSNKYNHFYFYSPKVEQINYLNAHGRKAINSQYSNDDRYHSFDQHVPMPSHKNDQTIVEALASYAIQNKKLLRQRSSLFQKNCQLVNQINQLKVSQVNCKNQALQDTQVKFQQSGTEKFIKGSTASSNSTQKILQQNKLKKFFQKDNYVPKRLTKRQNETEKSSCFNNFKNRTDINIDALDFNATQKQSTLRGKRQAQQPYLKINKNNNMHVHNNKQERQQVRLPQTESPEQYQNEPQSNTNQFKQICNIYHQQNIKVISEKDQDTYRLFHQRDLLDRQAFIPRKEAWNNQFEKKQIPKKYIKQESTLRNQAHRQSKSFVQSLQGSPIIKINSPKQFTQKLKNLSPDKSQPQFQMYKVQNLEKNGSYNYISNIFIPYQQNIQRRSSFKGLMIPTQKKFTGNSGKNLTLDLDTKISKIREENNKLRKELKFNDN